MTMNNESKSPEAISEELLNQVNGGIGLLVPAVQKIREAAARQTASGLTKSGPGTLTLGGSGNAAGDGSV